jgi:uncharacterized SAM-dependent methyltransferase
MSSKYIKNIQISKKYGVSRPTVGKWLENAIEQKNNLQVGNYNGRYYILDNKHNAAELARLKDKGVKYRNKIGFEEITPDAEFYKTFNEDQIIEIISDIEFNKSIDMKFSYFGEGAQLWSSYVDQFASAESTNPNIQLELFKTTFEYIKMRLSKFDTINLVDLGTGNGYHVKDLIEILLSKGFKVTYTGIDISKDMLTIASKNIETWFPQVKQYQIVQDFEEFNIRNNLFKNSLTDASSCNLVLFMGSTIGNFNDRTHVLRTISASLGKNDYLIFDNGLDDEKRRTSFTSIQNKYTSKFIIWLVNSLGFKSDMYESINRYDSEKQSRIYGIKLTKDIDLSFTIGGQSKTISLSENDEIITWNHYSHSIPSLLEEVNGAGLNLINLALRQDNTGFLLMAQRKS